MHPGHAISRSCLTSSSTLRPTIAQLSDRGAIVLLLSHFGRPKGERRPDMSLALVAKPLADVLAEDHATWEVRLFAS